MPIFKSSFKNILLKGLTAVFNIFQLALYCTNFMSTTNMTTIAVACFNF